MKMVFSYILLAFSVASAQGFNSEDPNLSVLQPPNAPITANDPDEPLTEDTPYSVEPIAPDSTLDVLADSGEPGGCTYEDANAWLFLDTNTPTRPNGLFWNPPSTGPANDPQQSDGDADPTVYY